MQSQDLELQISKFKARRLKAKLAHYATLTSTFLCLSVFTEGFHLSTLLTFLVVLPLPLYFALQSLKLHRKIQSTHQPFSTSHSPSKFSLKEFLTQPNLAFRLSFLLFFLVLFTTFARLRTPDPTLSLNSLPLTIDH